MQTVNLSSAISEITERGRISSDDCALLRRNVFGDNAISTLEADSLFTLNNFAKKAKEWDTFFVEAITHFLVRQTMPHGYINQANASWLMARINHDGVVETRTELELLVYILQKADNVTENLEHFALGQVVEAVLNGRGYMGKTRSQELGVITVEDVALLRRVLYACASEGGVGISRAEAEILFDLNDATIHSKNHKNWTQLFVGGIANHIMMLAAWNEPDMNEALRREKWLQEPAARTIPSFKGMGSAFKNLFSTQPQYTHTNTARIAVAEQVSQSEASWLITRMNRDGVLHENEKELLRFFKQESPEIHESLAPLLNTV